MPVFSYLAYPVPGAKKELLNDLAALDYCEATPADNQEILILVTDTPGGPGSTISFTIFIC